MMEFSKETLFNDLEILYDKNYDCKSLIPIIRNLTIIMKDDHVRTRIEPNQRAILEKTVKIVSILLSKKVLENEDLQFLAELFRLLRNMCAGTRDNQKFIINSEIYNCGVHVLVHLLHSSKIEEIIVLKCCLQFFGNLVCLDANSKEIVWQSFLKESAFRYLLQNDDKKVYEYTLMVLYNCMSEENIQYIINTPEGHDLLVILTSRMCEILIDWGILFLELIIKHEDFMEKCYSILPTKNKLLILDIIIEQLNFITENSFSNVPLSLLIHVMKLFIDYAMNIVEICDSATGGLKSLEIVKLLSLLCSVSVLDYYNGILKNNSNLLQVSLDTLKVIHLLGKKSCNSFSCLSNIKEMDNISKEEIECHPSYGFKKNLIRLIGNLCYECRENQDLIRKLDGIPLLLDCCNLDARNPFIIQWCILAIRNLLEKNPENQEILASISVTGDLVNSSLLHELGFSIQNVNGKYILKPLQNSS